MFKQGKFYAITGLTRLGKPVFLEGSLGYDPHKERLRTIARKAARYSSSYDEESMDYHCPVSVSQNPFEVKTWDIDTDIKVILASMRAIRKNSSDVEVDPNSLKIVIVETSVSTYVPESPSDEETELRRYVLEKLSDEEKELLKVKHWDVYGKLADRSMLEDDEDS